VVQKQPRSPGLAPEPTADGGLVCEASALRAQYLPIRQKPARFRAITNIIARCSPGCSEASPASVALSLPFGNFGFACNSAMLASNRVSLLTVGDQSFERIILLNNTRLSQTTIPDHRLVKAATFERSPATRSGNFVAGLMPWRWRGRPVRSCCGWRPIRRNFYFPVALGRCPFSQDRGMPWSRANLEKTKPAPATIFTSQSRPSCNRTLGPLENVILALSGMSLLR